MTRDEIEEVIRTELAYRIRTTAAYYRGVGKYGHTPLENWCDTAIESGTAIIMNKIEEGLK